jgi:hypothetical protein
LHLTATYTPEQNGVAEWTNRTIVKKSRAMLIHSGLSTSYWTYAVSYTVYIQNRIWTKANDFIGSQSSFEVWHGHQPNLSYLQSFGFQAYILIRKPERDGKYSSVSTPGIFLGIEEANHNFIILNEGSMKVVTVHNITFNDSVFPQHFLSLYAS